jgi:hypothetical protein
MFLTLLPKFIPVIILWLMTGCTVDKLPVTTTVAMATPTHLPPVIPTPTATSEPCSSLAPLLRQLSQNDDPHSLIGVNNLILTPDGLFVRLTLTHPDADLTAYNLVSPSPQDTHWDAYVPLDHLCPLADEPAVVAVEAIRGDVQP